MNALKAKENASPPAALHKEVVTRLVRLLRRSSLVCPHQADTENIGDFGSQDVQKNNGCFLIDAMDLPDTFF